MTTKPKQKLELTWIGKDARPKLEPRILLEDAARSYHAKFRNPPYSDATQMKKQMEYYHDSQVGS